jgi:hypothetical protein
MTATPAIQIRDLEKVYGKLPAISGLNLELAAAARRRC